MAEKKVMTSQCSLRVGYGNQVLRDALDGYRWICGYCTNAREQRGAADARILMRVKSAVFIPARKGVTNDDEVKKLGTMSRW